MDAPHAIACVSFLNSKPLIEPLVSDPRARVEFAVPAALLSIMEAGRAAAALLPVVDFQHSKTDLLLCDAGGICCDGPTLTVRIFSQVPPHRIENLYADTDSHTSVILAQLVLRERFGCAPKIIPFTAVEGEHKAAGPTGAPRSHEAMLLIGDKVVNASPPQHEYMFQLDLGEQWKLMTGLPFVFAMWMIRRDYPPERARELAEMLTKARQTGGAMTEALLDRYAAEKQWPRELAREYFTKYLHYEITPRHQAGVKQFYELCAKHNLLESRRSPEYLSR
jgi:chorismate dehydratase